MALWNKVQQLGFTESQKICALYGEHFPIEVRALLADWIEEKIFASIELDPDNHAHEHYINAVVIELISLLEAKVQDVSNDDPHLIRIKLTNAVQSFRQRYMMNPTQLFNFLRHCLHVEQTLVEQATMGVMGGAMTNVKFNDASAHVVERLNLIKQKTDETSMILRRWEQEQEGFAIIVHERQKLEGILHLHRRSQPSPQQIQQVEADKTRLEMNLKSKLSSVMQLKAALEEKIGATVTDLAQLQSKVLDEELTRWKREQQLAGNGASLTSNLDTLQSWCEDLAELIWTNRHILKEAERLKQSVPFLQQAPAHDGLVALQDRVTQLLSGLVTSTFIVEKQPPQVMKTNTRFTATVRLLVGGRLNVHMTPPQVKVAIISEAQANALLKNDKSDKPCDTSGEILNNAGTMEYHQGTRHLSVHFRNMQLKRIKRTEKKGTESVMDEKFCLHFQCQFTVGEKELIFKIWTLSLPVVVIVHGNQEPHAWATVTWDNAFGEPGRLPFQVPERVPWHRVAAALNMKFKSTNGRALTEDNLRFLAEKAFRTPNHPEQLTWSQFCKEPLPERSFTFWEWFYAIMKLTREHLRGPWIDGSIVGFVGRQQAEDILKDCLNGTFLLRFSDSELGGVTIAWVHSENQIYSLSPFTSKDLATRSLADRINDVKHLIYLYPNIPKATAFSKYFSVLPDVSKSTQGYVKPLLITHIPSIPATEVDPSGQGLMSYPPGCLSQPTTPGSYSAQSPIPVDATGYAGAYDQGIPSGPHDDLISYMDDDNIDYSNFPVAFDQLFDSIQIPQPTVTGVLGEFKLDNQQPPPQ